MPPSALRHLLRAAPLRRLSTAAAPQTRKQNLERLADELLDLNRLERFDYNILFHLKTGLHRLTPAASVALSAAGASPAAEAAEKTAFDIKLEKYGADAKIKVIKEVRGFTELGLKEAKDLVEKAPVVIKKGVSKEEAAPILEKLKALGATVSLE